MVKHTQTIRGLLPTNCLSLFDHFVGFPLKRLTTPVSGSLIRDTHKHMIFIPSHQPLFTSQLASWIYPEVKYILQSIQE